MEPMALVDALISVHDWLVNNKSFNKSFKFNRGGGVRKRENDKKLLLHMPYTVTIVYYTFIILP